MSHAFRLSRLKAPRATVTAMVLVAIVFVTFGVVVSSARASGEAPTQDLDARGLMFTNWMFSQ